MTLRLTLFTQEVEDFVLEILIDPETTFHELHRLILRVHRPGKARFHDLR